jgi:WD40 repeat-containing protein SMU1
LELIESNEQSTAKILLRKSNVLRLMSEDLPDRYQQIENYLEQPKQSLYTTKERRQNIANGIIILAIVYVT